MVSFEHGGVSAAAQAVSPGGVVAFCEPCLHWPEGGGIGVVARGDRYELENSVGTVSYNYHISGVLEILSLFCFWKFFYFNSLGLKLRVCQFFRL